MLQTFQKKVKKFDPFINVIFQNWDNSTLKNRKKIIKLILIIFEKFNQEEKSEFIQNQPNFCNLLFEYVFVCQENLLGKILTAILTVLEDKMIACSIPENFVSFLEELINETSDYYIKFIGKNILSFLAN